MDAFLAAFADVVHVLTEHGCYRAVLTLTADDDVRRGANPLKKITALRRIVLNPKVCPTEKVRNLIDARTHNLAEGLVLLCTDEPGSAAPETFSAVEHAAKDYHRPTSPMYSPTSPTSPSDGKKRRLDDGCDAQTGRGRPVE